jgi:hypothetical protein
VDAEVIRVLIASLVVGIGNDDMGAFLADETNQGPHGFIERGGGKGVGIAIGRHIRISISQHPNPVVTQMRGGLCQLFSAQFGNARQHLGAIECWVENAPCLASGTADEYRTHTRRCVASNAASAFGGLVVRVGMHGKQAERAGTGVAVFT